MGAKVSIKITGASKLINADTFGKSDPFCMVHLGAVNLNPKDLCGTAPVFRTKTIENNLNPQWKETALVAYDPTEDVVFSVWDEDMFNTGDFLGVARLTAEEAKKGHDGPLPLKKKGKDAGTINVTVKATIPVAPK